MHKLTRHLSNLGSLGWNCGLTQASVEQILAVGFRGENAILATVASELALECKPITLRGLFYRVVSAGFLPDTSVQHYKRLMRVLSSLRSHGVVPYTWIVDSLRSTMKPPSWSGLADFADTVRDAYRKDFWHHLDDYVHVFCEKDAIAAVIQPVTEEFNVRLSPIRGYCSDTFAHEVGSLWKRIKKPIHAFYLGDYDASGFDIERDVVSKLKVHCGRDFQWTRLGINQSDFDDFSLLKLPAKISDRRYAAFIKTHGSACAEIDALPPQEIRRRVEESIRSFVPTAEWQRLELVEELERETFQKAIVSLEVTLN